MRAFLKIDRQSRNAGRGSAKATRAARFQLCGGGAPGDFGIFAGEFAEAQAALGRQAQLISDKKFHTQQAKRSNCVPA